MLVLLSMLVIIIHTMARHVRTSPQHGLHHICHARNHPSLTRSCRSRRESVGPSLQQLTQDDLCLPLQRKIKKFHPSSRQGRSGWGYLHEIDILCTLTISGACASSLLKRYRGLRKAIKMRRKGEENMQVQVLISVFSASTARREPRGNLRPLCFQSSF